MRGWKGMLVALGIVLAPAAVAAEPLTSPLQVHQALQAGRYAEVEEFHARLLRTRERMNDGSFLFEEFYYNVYWYSSPDSADSSYWPKIDAATRAWIAHSPKSHLAAMTRAFTLAYRGEQIQARGGSWAEVDGIAAEAAKLMAGSRAAGASDPLWHATRLRVASVQGLPRAEVVDLLHAALRVDPYPVRLWREAAFALAGGSRGKSDDLLWLMRLADQRTGDREGRSMYARVFHATYFHFGDLLGGPVARPGPEWERLHASFTDWKKRYPARYPPDLHAAMACAARDRAVTAALLPEIRDDPGVWRAVGGSTWLSRCREWAKGEPETPRT